MLIINVTTDADYIFAGAHYIRDCKTKNMYS